MQENSSGVDSEPPNMKIGTTDPKSGHPLSTTLSSLSVREKKEAKPNPPIPHNLSAPALNGRGNKPTPSSLAETTASKNQQGDRGDGTSKNFLHEKTPPFSGLEKISEKTLEKKGEKVSSKKSSTEVEKVSENSLVHYYNHLLRYPPRKKPSTSVC